MLQHLLDLDVRISRLATDHVPEAAIPVLTAITHLGGTPVVTAVGTSVALAASMAARSTQPALRMLLVVGGQNAVYNLTKRIAQRTRPPAPHRAPWTGSSFPSGHTATAAAAWPEIASMAVPSSTVAAALTRIAGPVVGTTRILLGVHWMTDVIAGLAVGWGWRAVVGRMLR